MRGIKNGDFLVHEEVIYQVNEYRNGIVLLDRIWVRHKQSEDPTFQMWPEKNVWSHSALKHKLVQNWFKLVPRSKKATIQVLFT